MTRIIVTVDPDGTSTVKVDGMAGPGCGPLTSAIEKALGKTTQYVRTHEWSQEPETERRRVGQR